tara:strand:- start:151 stop:336 length:186 start_codon:yes stop_codon:yes gene_type:complete
MKDLFSKLEFIYALNSLGLGFLVGSIFAIFKLNPPSPETLSGILGIVGIFLGWWVLNQIFN